MASRTHSDSDVKGIDGGWQPTGVFVHKSRRYYAECRCACGTVRLVLIGGGGALRSDRCGPCASKVGRHNLGHGHCVDRELSPTYKSWSAMRARCKHPYVVGYHNYGGRGITVCERWRTSFDNFLADMGERPSKAHQIDRIDNDGNYEPGNCRWATRKEQSRNRRTNVMIEHNGETMPGCDWAARLGLSVGTVADRLDRGWSIADAVTLPRQKPMACIGATGEHD